MIVAEGIKDSSQTIANWFEEKIGIESRVSILGHIQRGGSPSIHDRLMAYQFISHAIDGLLSGKDESVICFTKNDFVYKSIDEVANTPFVLNKDFISYLDK